MKVTTKDLARECGVNVSTVSRALRGEGRMSIKTREKILDTARRLGYEPNLAARSLVSGRAGVLWFILPQLTLPMERIPAVIAERYLYQHGYDLLLALHHNDPDVMKRLAVRLRQGLSDGAIVLPEVEENEEMDAQLIQLAWKKVPMVFLDRHIPETGCPCVTTDNEKAAAALAGRCLDAGCDSALLLFGDNNKVELKRCQGAKAAFDARGLAASKSLPDGKRTAVISSFQGAIESYFEMPGGEVLPREWHFAVFDGWDGGLEPASAVHVCEQDFSAMAELAADLLLKMLNGEEVASQEFKIPAARIFDVLPSAFSANHSAAK